MPTPLASIIVLNFNGKKYLYKCLRALFAQDYSSFRVVFVDNNSSDDSVDFIKQKFSQEIKKKKLVLIAKKKNYGFAEGNNIGYRASKDSKYVALINNDTIAHKDWLKEILLPLKEKNVGLVGSYSYEKENEKWVREFWKTSFLGMNLTGEAVTIKQKPASHLSEAFFVGGNGVALKTKDFKTLFDKDYFAYSEDTYLGWLAQLRGLEVVLNSRALIKHIGGGTKKNSTKKFVSFLLVHGSKNAFMNILLFYEWKNVIRVLPLFFINQLGHVVQYPPKFVVKVKAFWWIVRHFASILEKKKKIQKMRVVSDKKLITKMSGKFYTIDEHEVLRKEYRFLIGCVNWLSLAYCWLVRLPVRELRK